ncbi:MAG: MFS transporter [Oscillospiraceae bacterium]|nr:MFS transporter [Oscillospiraceae bacterium]
MQKTISNKRWIILTACIIVWACTSFPSLWGVFQADAAATYGITLEESAMLFPMCTAFYGIFSIVGGKLQDMMPPNIVAMAGSVFMAFGVIMLSVLGEGTTVFQLYVFFSLPFGGGCGLISPAMSASVMKWYADKKGWAMGMCGAVSSLLLVVMTYLSKYMLGILGMQLTVRIYGIAFLVLCVASCAVLINPTRQYIAEKHAISVAARAKSSAGAKPVTSVDFTPGEMLKTKRFWLLFFAGMCSAPAYMLIAPSIVTLGISRGLSESMAVTAVALATGVSAVGKFIIPALSDKIGRKKSAIIFTICTLVFSVMLMKATGIMLLGVYSALVFTYSGWTMLISPFITDMFGNANAGANVGFISLYNTLTSFGTPVLVTLLTPVLAANTNHIIGIVGTVIALAFIFVMDTNTAKLKVTEE